MPSIDDVHLPRIGHQASATANPKLIEMTDRGPRLVKVFVVVGLGLLIWWPLVFLALAFIVPAIAVAAVIASLVAAIAAPIWLLVRRIRAVRATMSLHRLRP